MWQRKLAMETKTLAVLVTIGFSLVGVLGDYFLKRASAEVHSLRTAAFYVGFVVYASTAFGWVFVMKHLKLGTIGVVYSISMILCLTTIGVTLFGETLSYAEIVGLILAIVALILLMRFA
jgi:drug/metabolite transporter (DMT)-like permease